ncbi:hypothetical protein AGMMS49938_04440 [Fibrobacterales bacterium]|nr:hypothetical protein AGMMS49938_04440 [Fibrobacterales bacterium]
MIRLSKVSIIVPVYKVEDYLPACIESIIAQTFTDWELILVDDGSPDKCPGICDEYAVKDEQIQVLHQKNQGVTAARKNGCSLAKGEWICFVDADDQIPIHAIDALLQNSDKADIVIGSMANGLMPKIDRFTKKKDLHGSLFLRKLLINKMPWGPYARIIKRDLLTSSVFNLPREIYRGEDYIMNLRLAQKIQSVVCTPDVVYQQTFRETSCTKITKLIPIMVFEKWVLKSLKMDFILKSLPSLAIRYFFIVPKNIVKRFIKKLF